MSFAWVRGKQSLKRRGLLLVAVCFASIAAAQEPPKPAARAIILPEKLQAGMPAMLAVLDSSGRLLPDVAVDLSSGLKVITDKTGRGFFVAPGDAGKLTAKIPGREITASSDVVAPEVSATQTPAGWTDGEGAPVGLRVVSYPHVLAIHDRFTIGGQGFRGEADSNHVFLAGQPCLVAASSPLSLVVLPGPNAPIGDTDLRVTVGGQDTGEIPVSAVIVDFSGPPDSPNAGTQGRIILRIYGTTERLGVEVRNGSPEIIQLLHGNVQQLTTSGGEDNVAPVEVKFLAAGNYAVTGRLVSSESGNPPAGNPSGNDKDTGHAAVPIQVPTHRP